MAKKRDDIIDDDGNIIPPPPPDHAVMAVLYLLEYGRKRGFQIGPEVVVGDVRLQVRDLRQQATTEKALRAGMMVDDALPGSDMHILRTGEE